MMLKLKLQYFGHFMRRVDSLEKTLMLWGIGGRRKRGRPRMRWYHRLDGPEIEWTLGDGDGQGGLVCCDSWGHKESDTTERLNWTELRSINGLSWWLRWWRICLQCRWHGFDPWGREDPLEKGMVTHSSIFAWRIPWTEEPGGLQSMGLQRVGTWLSD